MSGVIDHEVQGLVEANVGENYLALLAGEMQSTLQGTLVEVTHNARYDLGFPFLGTPCKIELKMGGAMVWYGGAYVANPQWEPAPSYIVTAAAVLTNCLNVIKTRVLRYIHVRLGAPWKLTWKDPPYSDVAKDLWKEEGPYVTRAAVEYRGWGGGASGGDELPEKAYISVHHMGKSWGGELYDPKEQVTHLIDFAAKAIQKHAGDAKLPRGHGPTPEDFA